MPFRPSTTTVCFLNFCLRSVLAGVMGAVWIAFASVVRAQTAASAPTSTASAPVAPVQVASAPTGGVIVTDGSASPLGANLFQGNFIKQTTNASNPNYVVAPGDRVAVNTWGTVQVNDVFTVDGQGNVFLPGIGPVQLAGVHNSDLTTAVRARISRVYRSGFEVYTNLLTAAPVAVYVTGHVKRPGRYTGIPSDSPLFFLDQAGGIDINLGSYRQIRILRAGALLAEMDLYAFLQEGTLPQVQFADGDTILVAPRGPAVELRGSLSAATLLEFKSAAIRGQDALALIPPGAQANEVTLRGTRDGRPFTKTIGIAELATASLQSGDIVAFRDEGRPSTILVQLEGEVEGPSVLAVRRGSRLSDVLNYVRVDPRLANTSAVHVRRASVARAQKSSIEDALFRLERSTLLALSQSTGESEIRVREGELMQKFVERAHSIQPLGRVVTSHNGQQLNLLVEEGDVIVVPQYTSVVRIGGEVQMTHAVTYERGMTAADYIERAGGYTDRSDQSKVIIMRASAEVSIGDPDMTVFPGDEVLVPPRVDTKTLQNTADVVQIIYQIAVAAAVVLAL